jgi:tight adherence protein B
VALIVVAFLTLLIVSFTMLAFATRPSKLQKRLSQRIQQIGAVSIVDTEVEQASNLLKAIKPNRYPRLSKILTTVGIETRLELLLVQADSKATVAEVFLRCLGFATAGGVLVALLKLPGMASGAAAIICGIAPLVILRFQRSSRLKAFNNALPEAIDIMARALRAGHSIGSAIEVISEQAQQPVAGEFGHVSREQSLGLPFRESLMNMSRRVASQDLQFLITAMLVQKETGGNLIEILDRTGYVIRERLRIHGEVRVKTAQGRLTGWILSALPVIMGTLINLLNPGFEGPLFHDPLGKMFLYGGCGMLVVGTLIVRKIVDIKV